MNENRITDDHFIINGINAAMQMEKSEASDTTTTRSKWGGPSTSVVLQLFHELSIKSKRDSAATAARSFTSVWKHRLTRETRVSLKWRMATKLQTTSTSVKVTSKLLCIAWRVVVHRKCDLQGSVGDVGAHGQVALGGVRKGSKHVIADLGFHLSLRLCANETILKSALCLSSIDDKFTLCSSVVYCDTGDTLSLWFALEHSASGTSSNAALSKEQLQARVQFKDVVIVPHYVSLRKRAASSDLVSFCSQMPSN